MKALMSVGALVGVVGLLLLVGMIFDVVPSNTVRLVEGYMPMQMLFELAIFVAGFAGLSYMMSLDGHGDPAILGRASLSGRSFCCISSIECILRFRSASVPCMGRCRSSPSSCGCRRTKRTGRNSSSRL